MLSSGHFRLIAALVIASPLHIAQARAQDQSLIWTFSRIGAGGAQLLHHVPETDNVQVSAMCGENSPDNATSFVVSVDTGDLKNGDQTRLRFSGGGREYETPGRVLVPTSEEALRGVEVVLAHDHALWGAFQSNQSFAYQIPGYQSRNLPLAGGQDTIRSYLSACRTLAGNTSTGDTASGSGDSIKDAFTAARELDTVAGYQAFINAYPGGFYADLAKAHLDKLKSSTVADQPKPSAKAAQQPSASPPLATFTAGPGATSWYNSTYSGTNGNQYAAAVQSGGLELVTVCTPEQAVGLTVREAQAGQYPQFTDRIRQGTQRDAAADLRFPGKGSFRAAFHSNEGRELVMTYPVATSNGIVRSLLSAQTLILNQPPFAAVFQLKDSRSAVCNVLNSCGAVTPECTTQPAIARTQSPSKSDCRKGQIRVDGRCMTRAAAVGFCGPGYRVHNNRCVHQNDIPQKNKAEKKSSGKMLKRNEGGTISEAACRRKGMIPESGYCVEND